MQLFEKYKKNSLRTMGFSLMFLSYTLAMAMSRMGSAVVTESNGRPCFSIQADGETEEGLPLKGIMVEEATSAVTAEYPTQLWNFKVSDNAPKTILHSTECIRYGEAPQNSIQRTLKPLEMFRVYDVSVIARNENSNMIAYRAEFCIKSDSHGKVTVQQIPDGGYGEKERYEACARPSTVDDPSRKRFSPE